MLTRNSGHQQTVEREWVCAGNSQCPTPRIYDQALAVIVETDVEWR
jgi:hypothetical protein